MTCRYAIYHAPDPESAWWKFGAAWLGRDERTGRALPRAMPAQLARDEFARMTDEPRRYGFHGTLKAPFRLADGVSECQLLSRVAQLAEGLKPIPLGTLLPLWMDGFLALVPASPNPALNALARACVVELDDLRAPLTDEERARRAPERLDARGRELLEQFGYPLVLERFRFHMTLTGRIDAERAGQVVAQIAHSVARLNRDEAPVLDRLCVFVEPGPGAAFMRLRDTELRA